MKQCIESVDGIQYWVFKHTEVYLAECPTGNLSLSILGGFKGKMQIVAMVINLL